MTIRSLPDWLAGGLPDRWHLEPYDLDAYPHLIVVALADTEGLPLAEDEITSHLELMSPGPAWQIVGYHRANQNMASGYVLLASRRPNPNTLHQCYLVEYMRSAPSQSARTAKLGFPIPRERFSTVRELPPSLVSGLNGAGLKTEAAHMSLHTATDAAASGLPAGWSHLLCPVTPLEVVLKVLKGRRDRWAQWELFMGYEGDPRDLAVDLAAELATSDPELRESPDALEVLVRAITE